MKEIIIVAPVYNEENVIVEFLRQVANIQHPASVGGLVVVDDGSTDQTVTLVEEEAHNQPYPIRLTRLSRNFGHQNAVLAGIEIGCRWAQELGIEWIGIIDADLQDRPEHFAMLMAEADRHDVVYAVRQERKDGWFMHVMAPLFYRLLSCGASFQIPNDAGAFCVLRRSVAKIICTSGDNDPYFPGLRAWVGFRQKGVPVVREQRAHGRSRVGTLGLFGLGLRAMLLYSNLPHNFIIFSGILMFGATLLISIVLVIIRLFGLIKIPGATTIVVLQLMALGIQIVFLGIISHMINRVKANSSRQRSWIIMEERLLK